VANSVVQRSASAEIWSEKEVLLKGTIQGNANEAMKVRLGKQ